VAVDASALGQFLRYDDAALSRLLVDIATTFVMAALVGGIQERFERQRELLAAQRSEDRQRALTDPASEDAERLIPAPQVKPKHETILVAEHEAVVREMVVAALERLGYRVMAAGTGEEAVRVIDRLGDEIDLLLSDVVMPGMSGPDLLNRARRTRPELRAIFMSGYTALTIGRPIQTGVTLLEKPFSGARLGDVVRQTLAGD
jgi:CheY-like chemotaxis protein